MADKLPSYVVPPSRQPTFLNSSALVGGAVGMLFGGPVATLAGAGIGSYFGKQRMEQQQQTGKVVTPPGLLNKGAFVGSVLGASAPALGVGIGLLAGTGVGLVGIATVAAFAAAGAFIGGKIVKHFQEREYRKAENYTLQHGPYVPPREQAQGLAMQQQQPAQGQAPQQAQQQTQAAPMAQAGAQLDPQQLAQLQALAAQGQQMAAQQPAAGMADKLAHNRPVGPQQR